MRNGTLFIALAGTVAAVACGPTEVTINAQMEVTGEMRSIAELEVQLLPYDRDAVFDSLAAAAATPEPEIPADLLAVRNEIAVAQGEWQRLDGEWALLREELVDLSTQMERLNPAEAQYRVLFQEFEDKEAELGQVERQRDDAFEAFTSIQGSVTEQANQVQMLRDNWGDEAFADYSTIVGAKIQMSGLDPVVDTTDADGLVVIDAAAGQYWVHARLERIFDELYWNVPLTVAGEPAALILDESNVQVRPIL